MFASRDIHRRPGYCLVFIEEHSAETHHGKLRWNRTVALDIDDDETHRTTLAFFIKEGRNEHPRNSPDKQACVGF
jgi:hypothetical protein